MNTNKLTLKDYIIIYLVIFLVAAFLGGFFLGAKVMENKVRVVNNNITNNGEPKYSKNEISKFNEKIFAPNRAWSQEIYKLIDQEEPINENLINYMVQNGKTLKSDLEIYTFDSTYLKNAASSMKENIELIVQALENENDTELLNEAYNRYLSSQKLYYLSIWTYDQSIRNSFDQIKEESQTDWTTWDDSSIHQKNFIITAIIDELVIQTHSKPEDITVHIDAYLKFNKEVTITLEEVVKLLIQSDSIHEKDFFKYSDWYLEDFLPDIPIYQ